MLWKLQMKDFKLTFSDIVIYIIIGKEFFPGDKSYTLTIYNICNFHTIFILTQKTENAAQSLFSL